MKYDHAVKHNGVMYAAGMDVPVDGSIPINAEKVTRSDYETLKENHLQLMAKLEEAENIASERYEEIVRLKAELNVLKPAAGAASSDEEHKYKKSEISRMNVDELKAYAPMIGVEVTEESTGVDLKKEIIEKMKL